MTVGKGGTPEGFPIQLRLIAKGRQFVRAAVQNKNFASRFRMAKEFTFARKYHNLDAFAFPMQELAERIFPDTDCRTVYPEEGSNREFYVICHQSHSLMNSLMPAILQEVITFSTVLIDTGLFQDKVIQLDIPGSRKGLILKALLTRDIPPIGLGSNDVPSVPKREAEFFPRIDQVALSIVSRTLSHGSIKSIILVPLVHECSSEKKTEQEVFGLLILTSTNRKFSGVDLLLAGTLVDKVRDIRFERVPLPFWKESIG